MQTILGSGGVIGNGVACELAARGHTVRLVSRHPRSVNPSDQLVTADLLDADHVDKAVEGSEVAYLVAGLPFRTRIWQAQWPLVVRNVIEACKRHGARLVFFDNVYLYGKVDGPMTEATPVNPISRKGEVRAWIAQRLTSEMAAGNITALIARSADFYGHGATNTFVHPMVFDKLRTGRKAAWLVNDDVPHSMTYTPDGAKAVALLGNTPSAFGEVWHLPTHPAALTGREFIEQVAQAFGTWPDYQVLRPWMLKLAGLFDATVREIPELLYQNAFPYLFDSTKFTTRFFSPTSYVEGIRQTAASLRG